MDYSEIAMTKQRYEICTVAELPPGSRRIVEIGIRSIGVFNVDNRFYAVRNLCPHQAAPLCRGTLSGTMLPADLGSTGMDWKEEYCVALGTVGSSM